MAKYVYFFGGKKAEGSAKDKNLLGGKGANLAEMVNIGIPVPAGFTVSTEVCTYYYKHDRTYPHKIHAEINSALRKTEKEMKAKFGDTSNPLLVSVRSGARVSMPGMMETILNVGLNDDTVKGLAKKTNNERFAYDCYRRFIQMYAGTAMHADKEAYEHALEEMKAAKGVELDTQLDVKDLKKLVKEFKAITKKLTGKPIPTDPMDQLMGAIDAVFGSWQIEKARTYRRLHSIPEEWGTAVNVCAMVFGNGGDNSATGVAFTRDPSTGEKKFFGEFLINAQGEDVVAGIRTPQPINRESAGDSKLPTLEEVMPGPYADLVKVYQKLEKHYRDMQDIEFTIEDGKLWMLQTRNGKRTGFAAVKIAVDLVEEKLLKPEQAIGKVEPMHLLALLAPLFHQDEKAAAIDKGLRVAKGINASPGAACGHVALSAERAVQQKNAGQTTLLCRVETSPEDIAGMAAAEGILTARGGATSHAAVVARGMGKPCVCGASELKIDYKAKTITVGKKVIKEGEYVSIDGTSGEVIVAQLSTEPSEIIQVLDGKLKPAKSAVFGHFSKLMGWVDKVRDLKVRANADTPEDANRAVHLGAEGIGLCRTEHMFFGEERIRAVRQMILAHTDDERRKALAKLLPFQRKDFTALFKAMAGKPVTVRLLDPPLHEFLPHEPAQVKELAKDFGISVDELNATIEHHKESNPMLGHRGCRLGISHPAITEMQTRAIMEAAAEVTKKGTEVAPEIMVPLIGGLQEFHHQKKVIDATAKQVMKEKKMELAYSVGTMIEVPRAALVAGSIAEEAAFFSFGTNDLTQMTLGLSRDDTGPIIQYYLEQGLYVISPFESLEQRGVGRLVKLAVDEGRAAKPKLKLGVCGEHGGDPESVHFFHGVGLDYVSCSPFRVPVARLAAAQAALANPRKKATARKPAAKKSASKKAGAKKK